MARNPDLLINTIIVCKAYWAKSPEPDGMLRIFSDVINENASTMLSSFQWKDNYCQNDYFYSKKAAPISHPEKMI